MELHNRQGRHEGFGFVRHDGELTVWLSMIGRKLRKELIAGNSGRSGEFGFLVDARPDFLSGLPCGRDTLAIVGDVEIGLIEGERLDQGRVILEDRLDLSRHGAVDVEPGRDEYELGALAHRDG